MNSASTHNALGFSPDAAVIGDKVKASPEIIALAEAMVLAGTRKDGRRITSHEVALQVVQDVFAMKQHPSHETPEGRHLNSHQAAPVAHEPLFLHAQQEKPASAHRLVHLTSRYNLSRFPVFALIQRFYRATVAGLAEFRSGWLA